MYTDIFFLYDPLTLQRILSYEDFSEKKIVLVVSRVAEWLNLEFTFKSNIQNILQRISWKNKYEKQIFRVSISDS